MDLYKHQKAIGQNIKRIREEQGVSQVEFAEALNHRGITLKKSSLSRMENGDRPILLYELEMIAELLKVPINLIYREADEITELLTEVQILTEKPRKDIAEVKELLAEILHKSKNLGEEAKAQYHFAMGLLETQEVRLYSAIEHYSLAAEYAKKTSNSLIVSSSLQKKANTQFRLKQYNESLATALESLKYLGKEESYNRARAHYLCGVACIEMGQIEKANEFSRKAEQFFESINNERTLGAIKHNYAEQYYEQGDMETAKKYYYEALEIQEKCGYSFGCCYTLQSLAEIYKKENNLEKARQYLKQAVTCASTIQARIEQALSLYRLSNCYENDESYNYLKQAGELLQDIDASPDLMIKVFTNLADYHEKRDDFQSANSFYRMAVKKGYEKLKNDI